MRVLDLRCTNCGAPLDLPVKQRDAICEFCGSRLRIEVQGDQARVEALDQIARDLRDLRRRDDLQQLDSDWDRSRDRYTVTTRRDGGRTIPTAAGTAIGMTVALVFAIFWIGMASKMGAPGFFTAFGFLFIAAVLFGGFRSLAKARAYQRDRRSYVTQRQELLRDTPE